MIQAARDICPTGSLHLALEDEETLRDKTRRLLEGAQDAHRFKPSAIALHPHRDELWVLSAATRALAVVSLDGALRAAYPLPRDPLYQPEGLAFLPNGDLLIASEGVDKNAALVHYRFADPDVPDPSP